MEQKPRPGCYTACSQTPPLTWNRSSVLPLLAVGWQAAERDGRVGAKQHPDSRVERIVTIVRVIGAEVWRRIWRLDRYARLRAAFCLLVF